MEEASAHHAHHQQAGVPVPQLPSPSSAAAPRFLVPINHPDSKVPAFAVLQFLGFSSPSSSVPALPIALSSPTELVSLQNASQSLNIAHNHSASSIPNYGASGESSSCSSDKEKAKEQERGKKRASSEKPCPVTKSGAKKGKHNRDKGRPSSSFSSAPSSPGFDTVPLPPPPPKVTISQTERQTIIHTNCSNFRDVVRHLTGASRDDKYLMPVTKPSVRRPDSAPTLLKAFSEHRQNHSSAKLFERRRLNKSLSTEAGLSSSLSLSICGKDLPPLVPSPVTPLASDFEKIFIPMPSPSPPAAAASCAPNRSAGVAMLSNPKPVVASSSCFSSQALVDSNVVVAETSIASVHTSRASLTLLPLFPESPCQ